MKQKLHDSNLCSNCGFIILIILFGLGVFSLSSMTNSAKAIDNNQSGSTVLNTQRILPLGVAQQLATATQMYCKDKGYSVTVSVLNRDGVDILLARGDGTTGATVEVAREKAYAAAGFQSPTSAMEERAKTNNPGIIAIDRFAVLPGGLPIKVGSELVGGIGVSGAPSGTIDEQCANAGIAAIASSLSNTNVNNSTNINNNSSGINSG
jgi:uncharacterized protein GlcG (DUF336 family)